MAKTIKLPNSDFPVEIPSFLSGLDGAEAHFKRLVHLLADRYHPTHDYGLAILARNYAIVDRWSSDAANNPTVDTKDGGSKLNPAVKMVVDAERSIRAYEAKFGLTPKDASRVDDVGGAPLKAGDPSVVGSV